MTDITVRKVKFDFPNELDDVLPGDEPVDETYLVAFSLTMPYLEPYLIRTYRSVLDQITDEGLASDVRAFIAQEAQHFQNHRRINKIIKEQLGPEAAASIQAIEDDLDAEYRSYTENKSDRFNLLYAEGFEAMTCAMAMTMFERVENGGELSRSGRFGAWQQLWAWHAAEEIEHRTVAFDVYEDLDGSYPARVVGSLRTQIHFQRYIDRFQQVLLPTMGEPAKHHIPGWLREGGRSRYFRTFLRSYNPGSLEQSPLVDMLLAPYEDA